MSWETVPLGEVVDVLSGFAFDSKSFGDSGEMPIVRIRDVVKGLSKTYFTGAFDGRYIVEDGDLLVGMDGEFNRGTWRGGPALLNQRVCKISARGVDPRYLYHVLPAALAKIEDATPFVTVKHLSVKVLREAPIPLPPLPEQRRIAAILDEADALHTLHERGLKLLEASAEACFTSMFGRDGVGPRVALRDLLTSSQLGLVRGAKELGSDRQTPYMRMDAIEPSGRLRLTGWSMADTSAAERTKYSLREGDFLFNTRNSREWVGKAAVVPKDIDGVFNNNILRLRFADLAVSEYLSFLWRRPTIRRQLEQVKSGTTSVFAIYARDLMEVQVPLPSAPDLRDFKEASKAIRRTRTTTEGRSLDALFASLQHRAFRGEL